MSTKKGIINFWDLYPNKTKNEIQKEIAKSSEHWSNYVKAKNTLYDAKLLRTFKQPESGYAEWIVLKLYNGTFPHNTNNKNYDIECRNKKIEVRSISRQIATNHAYRVIERDKTNTVATHFAFVYFQDFLPKQIILVKSSIILNHPRKSITLKELRDNSDETQDLSSYFINH